MQIAGKDNCHRRMEQAKRKMLKQLLNSDQEHVMKAEKNWFSDARHDLKNTKDVFGHGMYKQKNKSCL